MREARGTLQVLVGNSREEIQSRRTELKQETGKGCRPSVFDRLQCRIRPNIGHFCQLIELADTGGGKRFLEIVNITDTELGKLQRIGIFFG